VQRIVGVGRRQANLDVARGVGAIDHGVTRLATGVEDAQLIIVATPVDTIAEKVVQAAAACPATSLITDAGSTKEAIVSAVDSGLAARRSGPRFVGSHPLAGDHRTGAEHARGDLFDGRIVVVTPTPLTRPAAVTEVIGFWQSLGADVRTMSPAEHDASLAATSHLPHLLAAALAASTPHELLHLAASGWRDTTRVAGGDPLLWQPIFAANRQHVLDALDRLCQVLASVREYLEHGDYESLTQILQQAAKTKQDRDALGD
jgi:prephenate dehydrogenase